MKFNFPYGGSRAPVFAQNIVATSQPLASSAGIEALKNGGNAVDAALAAAITLTVVEPTMNGIGGDNFALIWDGKTLSGLNASGRSPKSWEPSHFKGRLKMPTIGWDTVTVPGTVSGWVEMSSRFGKLPFQELFKAAIYYAKNGFAVSPVIAKQWAEIAPVLINQPGFADAFTLQGKVPQVGEIWKFVEQARTLDEIAKTNGESFYRGDIARSIVKFSESTGGSIKIDDLFTHKSEWVEPIPFYFGDFTLYEIPPNGSGITAQIALGILEELKIYHLPVNCAERIHFQVEAMRLAFADVYGYVGDPNFMAIDPKELLNKEYLKNRAKLINPNRAGSYTKGMPTSGGTVYLSAADSSGMMVSMIQSNFKYFGSGVVAPGGIALHNRGMGFSLESGHPNQVGPSKKPFHTILPAFLTKFSKPEMVFGVMGGNMQPQGHLQFVMNYVYDHLNPQACSDLPRWRINDDGVLTVEYQMPKDVISDLIALGHTVQVSSSESLDFGSAQAIACLPGHKNFYIAGSDHRRDGMAVGF